MRKLIILIAGVLVPAILTAQLTQQWVARYYSTGGGGGRDSAQAVALDADGNVYVAGTSDAGPGAQADYVTIKYDPSGSMLWTAEYGSTSGGPDYARDIAVDASGNVYVFGRSYTPTGYEYATVKYSTGGEELWVARYKSAENATMDAAGLELDPDGNVLVTGSGKGPDGSLDYATVKYGPDGTKLWDITYDGPGVDSRDSATAIAVDASGSTCVTGYTGTGYATVIYSPSGSVLGSATHNPQGTSAVTRDVAPDGTGNFVVTGYRTDGRYLTIKYEPDGDEVWHVTYGSGGAYAEAVAIGSDGDVCVTGSDDEQFTTVKYSSSGEQQWVVQSYFASSPVWAQDKPFDIALDASGNVCVAGSGYSDYCDWHPAYVKYSHDGVELWKRMGDDWGLESMTGARMLAIDPSGDLVATGCTDYDCVTSKYNSSGAQIWSVTYDYPLAGNDAGKKVAFDGSGNAYILANSSLIVKYSGGGTEEWMRTFPGSAVAIAVDAAGNAHIAGDNGPDFVAAKYSPAGDQLWVRYYRGPGGPGPRHYVCGIVLDASGSVYVGGRYFHEYDWPVKFYLAAVKYSSAGEEQWNGAWLALESEEWWPSQAEATGVAVDGSGNAFVCGNVWDEGGWNGATVKFSGGPAEAWVRTYDNVRLSGMAADPAGNSYVFNNSLVRKYDADGEVCWTITPSLSITAAATDAAGDLCVTGSAYRSGSYDYATYRYSADGDLLWDRFYDGGSDDYPTAVSLAGNGNVYVTGYSKGTGAYSDYATVGYTAGGDLVGSVRYDGPSGMDDQALAVATGPGGRVCVTGQAVVVGHGYDAATVMYFPPATGTDDVGVTKISEPSGVIDILTETPEATVHNYGMRASSFDVWFEIRDAATNTVRYLQSSHVTDLAPGEDCEPPFLVWDVPDDREGLYYARCWTVLPGDVYAQNDMAMSDFVVEAKQQEPPFWTARPNVPAGPLGKVVQQGGAMATDPAGQYAYLLKGNNTCEFYRFDPATLSWSTLDPIPLLGRDNVPRAVKEGGTLAQVGGKFYATKGGNSLEFWEYDAAAAQGNRWTQKADVPAGSKGVNNGAGATGVQYGPYSFVYLLKASETFEFYQFSVSGDCWYALPDAPGDKNKKWAEGSCLTSNGVDTVYALKGEHNEFYAYVVDGNWWLPKSDLPLGARPKSHSVANATIVPGLKNQGVTRSPVCRGAASNGVFGRTPRSQEQAGQGRRGPVLPPAQRLLPQGQQQPGVLGLRLQRRHVDPGPGRDARSTQDPGSGRRRARILPQLTVPVCHQRQLPGALVLWQADERRWSDGRGDGAGADPVLAGGEPERDEQPGSRAVRDTGGRQHTPQALRCHGPMCRSDAGRLV